jgi:hypothetical protein
MKPRHRLAESVATIFATVKPVYHIQRGQGRLAMQRTPRITAAPFVTRRSTLGFSAVCVVCGIVWQSLMGSDDTGAGATGYLVAISAGGAVVTGAVAWFAGIVLALRANSVIWLVFAVLPFAPLNSVLTAMFCPASPPTKTP